MSIFLIRHGETLGNASRTVQLPDNPLSARGALQAARLARRLGHEGISLILSSDYSRAAATADHLRRATGRERADDRDRAGWIGLLRGSWAGRQQRGGADHKAASVHHRSPWTLVAYCGDAENASAFPV